MKLSTFSTLLQELGVGFFLTLTAWTWTNGRRRELMWFPIGLIFRAPVQMWQQEAAPDDWSLGPSRNPHVATVETIQGTAQPLSPRKLCRSFYAHCALEVQRQNSAKRATKPGFMCVFSGSVWAVYHEFHSKYDSLATRRTFMMDESKTIRFQRCRNRCSNDVYLHHQNKQICTKARL